MEEKWIAAVDLGGTTTKLAFVNMNGEIVHKWEILTDNSNEGKNITFNIAASLEQKLDHLGITKNNLAGIGMGAPGPVDYQKGVILNTVNLGWQDHFPLRSMLEADTALPVIIDNDANCAALGEMWKGAGHGQREIVCVTLGTGVGGGVIANGDIVQGVNGAGGEIGHITAIPEGGSLCNCGKTGCLETVASATGIVRLAKEFLSKEDHHGELYSLHLKKGMITSKDVFDCARNGDVLSLKVIEIVSKYLGLVLANIANTLNPAKIVLGGGVSRAGDILIAPVKAQFERFAFSPVKKSTEITLALLGNDAGVIGAAWLVKNKIN